MFFLFSVSLYKHTNDYKSYPIRSKKRETFNTKHIFCKSDTIRRLYQIKKIYNINKEKNFLSVENRL